MAVCPSFSNSSIFWEMPGDRLPGEFLEQFPVADVDGFTLVLGFHAPPGDGLQVLCFGDGFTAEFFFCALHNGGGQRVVARLFHSECYFQQVFLGRFAERDSARELGFALRQRSRFIESDGGELAQIFERCAAFYQNARPRRPRHASQHGARRRNGQGAGRGRHQHRHCPVKTLAERLVQHQKGKAEQHDQRQHRRHEPLLETVGEKLRRRLLRFGFFHQFYQAGKGAVLGLFQHLHFQHACAIDSPCEGSMFGRDAAQIFEILVRIGRWKFVHWHTLARDGRLVDGAFALHHHAVGGDFGVRFHDDNIANF
jgi:hypothetical protein